MDLSPRAVIAGRYRVDTKVGAGGMGEVWAGEHITVGVRVAVKTLLPAAAVNHEVIARFKREAMLLGRIRSDHVARVVDFVQDDVYGLVLVMELVEGDSLSKVLQEKPLSVEETIDLGVDIGLALKDLHKINIIHRDLKPGNIIMQPMPDGRRRAVVVDFGVSRVMNSADKDEDEELTGITRADMAVGTIEYMAPEQILNSRNVTPGSDIYALGAILFRACAGRHVFGNIQSDAELAQKKLTTESPPLPLTRQDKVAVGFAAVATKALKRRPSERYKSADELLADLTPVRDMARLAIAEMDSTTIDNAKGVPQPGGPPLAPMPMHTIPIPPAMAAQMAQAAVQAQQPPSSGVSAPGTSVSVTASHPLAPPPQKRGGVPVVVMVAAVLLALAGGVFLGPKLMGGGDPAAPGTGSTATAAPPQPSATATASATAAAPVPTATADPLQMDEPEILSAVPSAPPPPPKLTGRLPVAPPKATATAAASGAPTSSPGGAPTSAATAAPATSKPDAPKAPKVVF